MQPLSNDATSALLRAIRQLLEKNENGATVVKFVLEEVRSRGWASATFLGARHELSFRLEGEEAVPTADAFLQNLDAAEFTLRGHLVADVALVSEERGEGWVRISLEALTVEDS